MKAFVSYRHTGADEAKFRPLLDGVTAALRDKGVEPMCTYFDVPVNGQRPAPHEFMAEAFRMIDDCDFLFVLQSSPERSEGMLMEVGYCLAKGIPVVVAKKTGFDSTYLPDMAQTAFEWDEQQDLVEKIGQMGFNHV